VQILQNTSKPVIADKPSCSA